MFILSYYYVYLIIGVYVSYYGSLCFLLLQIITAILLQIITAIFQQPVVQI